MVGDSNIFVFSCNYLYDVVCCIEIICFLLNNFIIGRYFYDEWVFFFVCVCGVDCESFFVD